MNQQITVIDIETTDPNLTDSGPLKHKMGPGDMRKDGHIIGTAVQIKGKKPEYFLLNHNGKKDTPAKLNRFEKILDDPMPKVCHNGSYDTGWLESEGFPVNGKIHDTLIAGALLDEYSPSFSLDALSYKYLGERKGDSEIARYAQEMGWEGKPQAHLEKMPVDMVGRYAMSDIDQTLRLLDVTLPEIEAQGLREVYEMEIALSPLLRLMRRSGVKVDTEELEILKSDLQLVRDSQRADLFKEYGEFNLRSGKQISELLDARGIPYPKTDKGNPTLTKDTLPHCGELGVKIMELRKVKDLLEKFVDGAFPRFLIGDRLHPLFLQTKREEGGTVSGRFSCQTPNLTQVPVRAPIYGPRVRRLFLPDDGRELIALDYDGIESRIFAHYATHGEAIRRAYNENPDLDYHQAVADMAGIPRPSAKTVNFAALFGAGVAKISEELGEGPIKGRALLRQYHNKFPAVKATMAEVERRVRMNGYIKTIGGRRARITPAMRRKRQYYLFLNRLVQGSAADLLKKAMLDAWNAGIFEVITPHLLVHDEVLGSVEKGSEGDEAERELRHIMENAYEFRVPIKVSGGRGNNWDEAH